MDVVCVWVGTYKQNGDWVLISSKELGLELETRKRAAKEEVRQGGPPVFVLVYMVFLF